MQRPESGFWHVCLLHDNRSSHTSELVKQFLKSEKVTVLSRPSYFPGDLSVCDFFLSQNFLKTFLSGRRYKSELAFGSAMNKWLRGLLCISNRGEYISWKLILYNVCCTDMEEFQSLFFFIYWRRLDYNQIRMIDTNAFDGFLQMQTL